MKNTIKTLLILAGIVQGSAAIAETHSITISSGGQNDYSIVAGTTQCIGKLKKGKTGSMDCQIDMQKNQGGVALFTVKKGDESCGVFVGPLNPLTLVPGSDTLCSYLEIINNDIKLQ